MRIDLDLVRRVEHSGATLATMQALALAAVAPDTGSVAVPLDGGALVAFGHRRYVNRAMGLGLGDTPVDELVTAVDDFYGSRDMTPALEICPWAHAALAAALGSDGYRLERFRNVYVHGLTGLPTPRSATLVEMEATTAGDRARLLAGDAAAGTEARHVSDEFCEAMTLLSDKVDLLALVDGVPAACGSLTVADGVAWLGGAATAVAHRSRGLQSALVTRRLELASARGCALAAATAVPDGQSARNLERLGFQLAYTQAVLTRL